LKVAVTGAGGLVGRAVTAHCLAQGDEVSAFDHRALDITDEPSIKQQLSQVKPDVVFNCAAWTDVDGCESDRERAERANALGPELLALTCLELDALLITISTDYVFDGTKQGFYTQRDQPHPISIYGRSKLEGERRAQLAFARTMVVRSGYIFGAGGTNFLSTVLSSARQGKSLKAVNDMFGTPTYAPDLASRLHRLAQMDLPGIYHVVNGGDGTSFEGFARAAIEDAGLNLGILQSVSLNALSRPASRPRNSRLRCLISEAVGLAPLRDWRAALRHFISVEST
jgi:dTDP-4-dehydrorhamnose reductase